MNHNEKGSATLHSLFAAVLLVTALVAATLWSTISTARHKLATAADLTALSAAQSLTTTQFPSTIEPATVLEPATITDAAAGSQLAGLTQQAAASQLAALTPQPAVTNPASGTPLATVTGSAAGADPAVGADPVSGTCATAARVAALHKVQLTACNPTSTSVTVQVALQLDLPFGHPTLTATSRAGPI